MFRIVNPEPQDSCLTLISGCKPRIRTLVLQNCYFNFRILVFLLQHLFIYLLQLQTHFLRLYFPHFIIVYIHEQSYSSFLGVSLDLFTGLVMLVPASTIMS